MIVEYDPDANAAYVGLADEIVAGGVDFTYPCPPSEIRGAMINLDFDHDGKLVGIEVLDARGVLPVELLDQGGG